MARAKDADGKPRNVRIMGLSPDRKGLIGRIAGTDATFHIHSDEMTQYQRREYKKLMDVPIYEQGVNTIPNFFRNWPMPGRGE